jgi:hypothetical protein
MSTLWATFLAENIAIIGAVEPGVFVYSCNISLRHRYIYYETPKVGCSTIKLTLQRAELDDEEFVRPQFEDIHSRDFSPLIKPTQVGSFKKLLASSDIYKFCFVRNPFTRLLSCYLDKIARNRPQKRAILRQLNRPPDLSQPVTFDEFLDAVATQPPALMDPHWCIQSFHTAQGRIPYDTIGRWESLEEDFRAISNRLSIDFDTYYKREARNATEAAQVLFDYFDVRTTDVVRRIYAEDFARFRYSLELGNLE